MSDEKELKKDEEVLEESGKAKEITSDQKLPSADSASTDQQVDQNETEPAANNNEPAAEPVPESTGEKIRRIFKSACDSVNNGDSKLMKTLSYFVPSLLFVFTMITMVYFITSGYKIEFHADCTDTIMWANASIEGDAVYDTNFGYACFLPFGINTIMIPLIHLFGLSMKAHIIGMMSYFILLLVFFCLMLREMHWGIRSIMTGSSILMLMTISSEKMREIFWQHTIYYSLGILFIVIGMYMYCRIINLREKAKTASPEQKKGKTLFIHWIITWVCLLLFVMFTATDGISALSIFAVPFIGAIFAEQFADNGTKLLSKSSLRVVGSIVIIGIMIIAGIKLNGNWVGDLTAGYQDANSNYSAMSSWTDHVHSFPMAWLRLNGVKEMGGQRLSDKEGIKNLIYLASSLLLMVIPIIATCFYPKFKDSKDAKMLRIWIWLHWFSSAIVLLGYIVGVLSGADWRITPIIGTSIIITVLFAHWAISNKTVAARITAVISIPVLCAAVLNIGQILDISKKNYTTNNLYGMADFLEDQGLTYGYATFWNANSITLITDSKVKVRDVNVDDYGVSKRIYQSSEAWYKDQPGQDKYFLLLNPPEYQKLVDIGSPLLEQTMQNMSAVVNNTEYKVLVFDHNIV